MELRPDQAASWFVHGDPAGVEHVARADVLCDRSVPGSPSLAHTGRHHRYHLCAPVIGSCPWIRWFRLLLPLFSLRARPVSSGGSEPSSLYGAEFARLDAVSNCTGRQRRIPGRTSRSSISPLVVQAPHLLPSCGGGIAVPVSRVPAHPVGPLAR